MKKASIVIAAVLCIALVICFVQIADLKNQLQSVRFDIESSLNTMRNDYNNQISHLYNRITEEESPLSDCSFEIIGFDTETYQADILCTVALKEFNAHTTEVKITLNGEDYDMKREGNVFTAHAHVPVFEETVAKQVAIIDGLTVKTVSVNEYVCSVGDFLPMIKVDFSGPIGRKELGGDKMKYTFNCDLNVNAGMNGSRDFNNSKIERAELAAVLNGREAWREPIAHDAYYEEQAQGTAGRNPALSVPKDGDEGHWYLKVAKEVELALGDEMELRVELHDSLGLTYSAVATLKCAGEDYFRMNMWNDACTISDAAGTVLYDLNGDIIYNG